MRPLIGITLDDEHARPGLHVLRDDYVRSVEQAGAVPMIIPPSDPGFAPAILDRLDGLLLSGGVDVDPALFGQERQPGIRRVDRKRDDLELALTREALERDLPILAICRGIQLLNVARGGTLIQHLPSELAGSERHDCPEPRSRRVHEIDVEPGSRLHGILGAVRLPVNSLHHQAVGLLGEGLRTSASCDEDGVVEGVEMPDRSFVLGVQWHPETFWNQADSFQALFDAQVAAAIGVSASRSRVVSRA
jgi:putative glutamine amidotransferase